MFKRDKEGDDGQPLLPPVPAGEDVPRWLVVLGLAAGLTLFVALLRYAIDLLAVVFVITLVGFAIRTLGDWLTEGESISGWAMSALTVSLIGTVLTGIWLFNSRGTAGDIIGTRLPGPVQRSVGWLEARGWGQRVLLAGGSSSGPVLGGGAGTGTMPQPTGSPPAPQGAVPSVPAPRMSTPRIAARPADRRRAEPLRGPDEAEAAPAPDAPGQAATADQPAPAKTALVLSVSPARPVVGVSVRLTATLSGARPGAVPGGRVTFYRDNKPIGQVPLRRAGDTLAAVLVTLDLPIGDHELHAAYEGDAHHAPSRSADVRQTVVRK